MGKYLWQVSYTLEGVQGLRKDGGSKRVEAANTLIKSLGGTMEAFYFAFGSDDAIVIADLPDHASAVAAALIVGGSGGATLKTTMLLTPVEVDSATKKTGTYTKPGG